MGKIYRLQRLRVGVPVLRTTFEALKYTVNHRAEFDISMDIGFSPPSGDIFWWRGLLVVPFRQFRMCYQAFRVV